MPQAFRALSMSLVLAAAAGTTDAADPAPDPRLSGKPPEAGAATSPVPRGPRDDYGRDRNIRGEPEFGNRRESRGEGGYRWGRVR